MKNFYRRIIADENLAGDVCGYIKHGVMNVAPEVFMLLKDGDVRNLVMEQLKIIDVLHEGKQIEVFDGTDFKGTGVVVKYPMEGAPGFAMVRFYDERIMGTDFCVRVEWLVTNNE